MKNIGIVLLVVGIVGLAYFGYQAMQDSESFEVLGADVAVSTADWTPVIISGIVALVGLVLTVSRRGK
jgi:NO-binding membrane sensor protein with MHYT domain